MRLTAELFWLAWTLVLALLIVFPYVGARIINCGLTETLTYRDNPALMPAWATRLQRSHTNLVENLVVFAPLAIIVSAAGLSTPLTGMAAAGFFIARLAHAIVSAWGVPLLRTLAFFAGWIACAVLAARILI